MEKIPKLAAHMGWGGALKLKGGQAGGKLLETLKTSFSAKVIAATAAFMAMKAAWDYFNDKFNLTFDAASIIYQ